jgi:hypothetical protein
LDLSALQVANVVSGFSDMELMRSGGTVTVNSNVEIDSNDITILQWGKDATVTYGGNPFRFFWSNSATGRARVELDIGTAQTYMDFAANKIYGLGGGRFGSTSNYADISSGGDLTFAGTGDYLVASDDYAFRAVADQDAGFYFNATSTRYELRDLSATPDTYFNLDGGFYTAGNSGIGIAPSTARRLYMLQTNTDAVTTPLYMQHNNIAYTGNNANGNFVRYGLLQDVDVTGTFSNNSGTAVRQTLGGVFDITDSGATTNTGTTTNKNPIAVFGKATVSGTATGASTRDAYGGWLEGVGTTDGTTTVYGVYATASGGDTNWAGWFAGDVNVTGKVTSTGGYDPPYVLYDCETRESVKKRVLKEVPKDKQKGAALFFNSITKKLEIYIAHEDCYYNLSGYKIIENQEYYHATRHKITL